MIALAQRVNHASVSINGKIISSIGKGVCIFLGIRSDDTPADCDYLISRLEALKIFGMAEHEHFAVSLQQNRADVLIVSQFTLYADLRKGTGPSFTKAMAPKPARELYQLFCEKFSAKGYNVKQGEFGAYMQVTLENDGPVTFSFSSDHLKRYRMNSIQLSNDPGSKPKLLVGLGNPGKEYAFTRHNAGILFLDYFLALLQSKGYEIMKQEEKLFSKYFVPDLNLFLLKPKTFMNLSGTAVKGFLDYARKIDELIVVHDDLDIKIGEFKVTSGKGPKLHNGINSLEEALQTTDFLRIRIGIENRQGTPIPGLDYVLYDFAPEELQLLVDTFAVIIQRHFKFSA